MSTFDIEAAKRGEPVEMSIFPDWVPVHFVGQSIEGLLVVQERVVRGRINYCSSAQLRMAPKKIKVRYRTALLRDINGEPEIVSTLNTDFERVLQEDKGFVRWLTDWQEAEVEQ